MSARRPPAHLLTRVPRLSVAVVGGGWAGLASAVTLVRGGHDVTLHEMAPQLGGRARRLDVDEMALDNGQHILIGAYTETLRLMRQVDADPDALLMRLPLHLVDGSGRGLRLPAGPATVAFAAGVLRHPTWTMPERLSLLATSAGWFLRGFRCAADTTVAELTHSLPLAVRQDLVDPLCVAALNTPAEEASARVFLRVMRDALFAGPGSSDLLLPRASLGDLFPTPAVRWLEAAGAVLRRGVRVHAIAPDGDGWNLDGRRFDRVIVATPPLEASRLLRPLNPAWADRAEGLRHEPIVTVYVRAPGARLPSPMVALPATGHSGPQAAQFAFDHGILRGRPETSGLLALVISGARPWLDRGPAATEQAVLGQVAALTGGDLPYGTRVLRTVAEKRATFRCTPALLRPGAEVASGLWTAGDHVDGPYPATLEGAVRSGVAAALAVQASVPALAPPAMQ
jgi:hydroxysqualene dehydroxylase